MHYYKDVQDQAKESFRTAKRAAIFGFLLLAGTLIYTLVFDALSRFNIAPSIPDASSMTISKVGIISGVVIELISGVAFWLYSRGAGQFGAFRICLERTHRYLLAYKVAEQIETARDMTLRDLVCIMANAPMITGDDIDSAGLGTTTKKIRRLK